MHGMEVYGSSLQMDHSAAEGQTRTNNDFGRVWKMYITGRKTGSEETQDTIGAFHELPSELQESIIQAARDYAKKNKKDFYLWLKK